MPQADSTANAEQTSAPRTKVLAAAGGAGVGGAVALILCWALDQVLPNHVPEQVQSAIALLTPLVLSYLAGYYTPPGAHETAIRTAAGKVVSAT